MQTPPKLSDIQTAGPNSGQLSPIQAVRALEGLQLPHSRLLYMITHMYKKRMITENQRMELKRKSVDVPN